MKNNFIFEKTQTQRGFKLFKFSDEYFAKCSLQESSNIKPCVWLGVDDANPKIMAKDAVGLGIDTKGQINGWVDYEIPKDVLLTTRMHLNQEQAKALAKQLLFFAKHGYLK